MSPRYSTIRSDVIDYGFWLIFDADGGMRFSRGEPSVGRGEVAMACTSVLPRALFSKPSLTASITVDPQGSTTFNVDVRAVQAALKGALGVDIDLRVSTAD